MNRREIILLLAGLFAGGALATALWCVFVVPSFEATLASYGVRAPGPVLIAIKLSHVVIRRWWLPLVVLVPFLVAALALTAKRRARGAPAA